MQWTDLQEFQFYDKYARFDPDKGRREKWEETVHRASMALVELSHGFLDPAEYAEIEDAIFDTEVMPSMRLMAMAGPAGRRENNVLYNCAFLPIDRITSFVEMMVICMGGTGVGYSVERQYTQQLPMVSAIREGTVMSHTIADSSEGWATALSVGLKTWWSGYDVEFDYSLIRPQGAPLKTKGGRASGPEPLRQLLDFARKIIRDNAGGRLSPLNLHDIATKLGDVVVQGGVRRSALIALFDQGDKEMLTCKDPGNIEGNWHRYNSNNSAVWTRQMSRKEIAAQMYSMDSGKNGEPGIFSRYSAMRSVPERRVPAIFGTNPCGEILLRPRQFCNLTTAIARADDTEESLKRKVELAARIGTIQSAATYFPNLPDEWRKNGEEERLLGVDLNGQMDCPLFHRGAETAAMLDRLRDAAVAENVRVAGLLGINPSAAVTCVKPSGNSSVLLDCSPGIHPRYAPFYTRRVRVPRASAMYGALYMQGMELVPENGQEHLDNPSMYVAEFYVKSPDGAVCIGDMSAIEQLNYWLMIKTHWTEHNPSATITYRAEELEDIIDWLFENQAYVNGLSFLPASDIMYDKAPYEAMSAHEYGAARAKMPDIDFTYVNVLDAGADNTTASQELACFAGQCEII